VVYEALYASTASWLPHPAGLCWSLAYFLSIRTTALLRLLLFGVCAKPRPVHSLFNTQMAWTVWQHALHRWLVFGSDGNYWKSLLYTYACYSLSIVLSGVLNDALVEYFRTLVSSAPQ
jgi:hypothetical protein